jgi:hypothetical protein
VGTCDGSTAIRLRFCRLALGYFGVNQILPHSKGRGRRCIPLPHEIPLVRHPCRRPAASALRAAGSSRALTIPWSTSRANSSAESDSSCYCTSSECYPYSGAWSLVSHAAPSQLWFSA